MGGSLSRATFLSFGSSSGSLFSDGLRFLSAQQHQALFLLFPFSLLLLPSFISVAEQRNEENPRCGRWENNWGLVSGYRLLVKPW
jgi:hypothetical protein